MIPDLNLWSNMKCIFAQSFILHAVTIRTPARAESEMCIRDSFKFNRLSRKEETRRLQHDPQQVRRVWQNTVNNARGTCLKRKSRWHVDITRHSGAQRLINFRSRFVWCRRMVRECSLGGSPPLRHRTIKFGAKYTATDRMNWNVLTQEQMATLKDHAGMGAATAVCVGIKEHFFFLPWDVWRDYESNLWTKICDWWRSVSYTHLPISSRSLRNTSCSTKAKRLETIHPRF